MDRGVRDGFADDVDGCSGQCAGGFQAFARDRIDGNCDLDNSTPGIRDLGQTFLDPGSRRVILFEGVLQPGQCLLQTQNRAIQRR